MLWPAVHCEQEAELWQRNRAMLHDSRSFKVIENGRPHTVGFPSGIPQQLWRYI